MNRNRYIGNSMKREYTEVVSLAAYAAKLRPVSGPVELVFQWVEPNGRRDPDNIVFAKKFILDGLVEAGILPNDTQSDIFGFIDAWFAMPPKNSKHAIAPEIKVGVTVTIRELIENE